jgi:hypothetical protein
MKKSEWIIITIFIVVLAIIFLGAGLVDNAINSAFNPVDKSCNVDSDCTWKIPDCTSPCGSVAANKNWNALCPIPQTRGIAVCSMGLIPPGEMKCLKNTCEYVSLAI